MILGGEYRTYRNIVYREQQNEDDSSFVDEDLYSSHSNYRTSEAPGKLNTKAAVIKGQIYMNLKAELGKDFLIRMDALKNIYIEDAKKKVKELQSNLEFKQQIISQALDGLYHIQFDMERGLVADQIDSSLTQSTIIDGNASIGGEGNSPRKDTDREKVYEQNRRLKAKNLKEIESLEKL